jgi:hypothetical protein
MRCSGEGPGSKAVGWWTRFGAAGRKSSPEEHALWRGVVGWRGTAVGAASGGGGRQLVVWGGCTWRRCAQGMVESVGERTEQVVHGGSVAAGTMAQWGAKGGGGRKDAPRWGWAPFIAARGGGRRRRGGGESVGGEMVVVRPWVRVRQSSTGF